MISVCVCVNKSLYLSIAVSYAKKTKKSEDEIASIYVDRKLVNFEERRKKKKKKEEQTVII